MHKQVHDSNYIVKFFGITKHPLTHDTCIVTQFAENGSLQDYLASGSPSSINATVPSVGGSPNSIRRDFRPISFLTQQQQPEQQPEHSTRTEHSRPTRQAENAYVPNPNNNIVPPSQLNMQRAQSPELRREVRNSRILGSPSLRPAALPVIEKRVIISPHLSPMNPRPVSPAFSMAANGGFPVVESFPRGREATSK